MRLLVGCELTDEDADALAGMGMETLPQSVVRRLQDALVTADDVIAHRLGVLGWLLDQRRLEVKVAVAVDSTGKPMAQAGAPYFHEKIGVAIDETGDGVAFTGSSNETVRGWRENFESICVFPSWSAPAYFDATAKQFDKHWEGKLKKFKVYGLPEAVHQDLVRHAAPEDRPPVRDVAEPVTPADTSLLAAYMRDAPHLVRSQRLAQTTTGVELFPHQAQVVERLAGMYPKSWLLADEVGLGKTISAGLALRRLLLSGEVKHAVVLAPASVCRQWQDELFEKFGLWVPVLEAGRFVLADGSEEAIPEGPDVFRAHQVVIASSHLIRRRDWRDRFLRAGPLDLVVVDEAHQARRRGFQDIDHEYRPNRLLELLDAMVKADTARATWLLTATPMQMHPVELLDLLRHVGLYGEWERWDDFARYFETVAGGEDPDWPLVARLLGEQFDGGVEPDPQLLARLESALPAGERFSITQLHTASDPAGVVASLSPTGKNLLTVWCRRLSPVGQLATRHTRRTLRRYAEQGLLKQPIATRHVEVVPIQLSPGERELYDQLDGLIERLMIAARGDARGLGYVQTVYQRRLTSSWAAIEKSFRRRLEGQVEMTFEDIEATETDDGGSAPGLSAQDETEMASYLQRLGEIQAQDSKVGRLVHDIDAARARGDGVLVFTQFTDTLDCLRAALETAYSTQLATFTGDGGRIMTEGGAWVPVSKRELVAAFQSGARSVLLATDAASEGLNLQAVGSLINFDLPWNPMRVEQRIGRIDRIGQPWPTVTVLNYVIPGTVEDTVYEHLVTHMEAFNSTLGPTQPAIGAAEGDFRRIYAATRQERHELTRRAIEGLDARSASLREAGVEVEDEDDLPIPDYPPSPVLLSDLETVLSNDPRADLAMPGMSFTFDPARVSRDPTDRTALITYGHPRLLPALGALEPDASADPAAVREERDNVIAYARADLAPPTLVNNTHDLAELGDAAAVGDAIALADSEIELELAARRLRRREAARSRQQRVLLRKKAEFVAAVRRGVAARFEAVRAESGLEPSRNAVLDSLIDDLPAWRPVDAVASRLKIDRAELVSPVPLQATVQSELAAASSALLAVYADLASNGST